MTAIPTQKYIYPIHPSFFIEVHLVTFFPVRFSSQDSQPARSETQSTIGSLRLSLDSDSDEGDIEER